MRGKKKQKKTKTWWREKENLNRKSNNKLSVLFILCTQNITIIREKFIILF